MSYDTVDPEVFKARIVKLKGARMDPKFKEGFVQMLRSRQYDRTTGKLIDCDGDCCLLGVAAKGLENMGLVDIVASDQHGSHASAMDVCSESGDSNFEMIPQDAASKVGITADMQVILSSLNDERPVIDHEDNFFMAVADLIETHL